MASEVEHTGEAGLMRAREARMSAVRLVRAAERLSIKHGDVAEALGVPGRTLRGWKLGWQRDRLSVKALGRPRLELSRSQRAQALEALNLSGGRIGVPGLMEKIEPRPARSALKALKERWRHAAHRRGGALSARLEWTRVGSVWAMDWTNPEMPIEGYFTKILVVRDLASGLNLLSLPCARESGKVAAGELQVLIRRHGAPAVVKSDNGSSLRCGEVRLVLDASGILALVSPPACPGYNGACEAGIGALKTWIHHTAAASGRAHAWSCEDVVEGRRAVNTRVRENGLSAEDSWSTRRPLSDLAREQVWSAYREHLHAQCTQRFAPGAELTPLEQASLDRAAISRALAEVGLVRFRRRWIRPPIRPQKVPRKS